MVKIDLYLISMSKERNITNLPLDGGLLCLDFVNTVQTRKKLPSHEYLPDYPSFLEWCVKVNISSKNEIDVFNSIAVHSPAKAITAYHHILIAREILYKFFSAKAAGNDIADDVLEEFNKFLAESLSHIGFHNNVKGPHQIWINEQDDLVAPLWKVLKSAYDILTADESKYVKECPACGWLFLDRSRTHTRRWCNPLECGSVDKATRYYHRMKAKKKV
jgi:predicted RNA-binding Zn ribbon-like protein